MTAPVLWIGGPPGAGKTTIARLLARRYGLRWFSGDARTWIHRDRAIAAGHPDAIRWESLGRTARWALPTPDLLAMSLHRERGPMFAEDLAALPSSPLTVAEGTAITPAVAGTGARAVWLMPSARVQEARLLARGMDPHGGAYRLYRALLPELAAALEGHGHAVVEVTAESDVDEVLALVEERFAEALATGPVAAGARERAGLLRYANRALVDQYCGFFARPWAPPDTGAAVEFSCECGDRACREDVAVPVAAFPPPSTDAAPPRRAVLAPGHRAARG